MSLIQYITRKRKKHFLSLQDLNIIKQRVDEIWKYNTPATWKDIDLVKLAEVWSNYRKTIDDIPYHIERVGVMYADVLPNRWPDQIIVGFSLCHTPIDQFDHIADGGIDIFTRNYRRKKGLGRRIAYNRAFKWADKTSTKQFQLNHYAQSVPPSIHPDVTRFIQRAVKYYSDKKLTPWAHLFMLGGKDS